MRNAKLVVLHPVPADAGAFRATPGGTAVAGHAFGSSTGGPPTILFTAYDEHQP